SRRHDGAAVARMGLDDLAFPPRIEQIGETLRCVLAFHQLSVIGNHTERSADRRIEAIGIAMLRWNVAGNVPGHAGHKQILSFPCEKLRGVAGTDRIGNMQSRRIFLCHARKNSLAAGSLDTNTDARKLLFEGLADFFRELEVGRSVPSKLALFCRR